MTKWVKDLVDGRQKVDFELLIVFSKDEARKHILELVADSNVEVNLDKKQQKQINIILRFHDKY